MPTIAGLAEWNDIPERWVVCIDVLGFKARVKSENWKNLIHGDYNVFMYELIENFSPHVHTAWFSDTFIFYTKNVTQESLGNIEERSRHFINALIRQKIPLRGALSCGKLMAHAKSGAYLGPALVEAYEYAEAQDWIGHVITPTAKERMQSLNRDLEFYYTSWEVPLKKEFLEKEKPPKQLLALLIGLSHSRQLNDCHESLKEMRERCKGSREEVKYLNTIKFLEEKSP
jgi:hypothetical protein